MARMSRYLAKSVAARVCVIAAVLVCLGGCLTVGDYYRPRLQSPIPHERGLAVVEMEGTGDPQVVPALVDTLEDADAGVRLLAIQALLRMCGNDYGYRYYQDESRRTAAVERWRAALRNNEIIVKPDARQAAGEGADTAGTSGDDETRASRP
jgi:hypothetical protein